MKIAICDDLHTDIEYLCDLIEKTDIATDVHCFSSSADLLKAFYEGGKYDVMFLDIEMDEPNGFQTATELKENGCDSLIIFVTVTDEYVYDGYEVAWRYVPKPISYEKVQELLQRAERIRSTKIIEINTTDGQKLINLSDICYIEVSRNTVHITTHDKQFKVNSSMRDVETLVNSTVFVKPHSSYLINLSHIDDVSNENVHMDNGKSIPLARGKKQGFWNAYRDFVRSYS